MSIFYTMLLVSGMLFLFSRRSHAHQVPHAYRKCVAFIYLRKTEDKAHASGTGFFVGVPDDARKERGFTVYFVTCRHILLDREGQPRHPEAYLRINTHDGEAGIIEVPLVVDGDAPTIIAHPDPSVDLAVIPILPDQEVYDFLFLTSDQIVTDERHAALKAFEGTPVFYMGLFTSFPGIKKNYPVTRFGRVALIADEPIPWEQGVAELHLVEVTAYEGTSGSPVFYELGDAQGEVPHLAGLMKGIYYDAQPVREERQNRPILTPDGHAIYSRTSNGIAAMVPAQKLHELLHGPVLIRMRQQ